MPPELSQEIHKAISIPRLSTYLTLVGTTSLEDALLLYRLNARLSGAFVFPLQSLEVALRNSLATQLGVCLGTSDWLMNRPTKLSQGTLSERQLEKILNAEKRFQDVRRRQPTQDSLISDLDIIFWTEFLDKANGRHRLWPDIKDAFPNLPTTVSRGSVFFALNRIRKFRNRIAHHEPIINPKTSPLAIHAIIIETLWWISRDKSAWTEKHSQVGMVWQEILSEKNARGWTGFSCSDAGDATAGR
jgi:hypothetical protein